jgi:hypothetical protein
VAQRIAPATVAFDGLSLPERPKIHLVRAVAIATEARVLNASS